MTKSPTPETLIEQRARQALKLLDSEDLENVEAWVAAQVSDARTATLATVQGQRSVGQIIGGMLAIGCCAGVIFSLGAALVDGVDRWQACPVVAPCPVCPTPPTPPAWEKLTVTTPPREPDVPIGRLQDGTVTCWHPAGSTAFLCVPRTDMTPPILPGGPP